MAKQTLNNVKLGIFVIAGLFLLVLMLYMIGKNQSLFTDNFVLKVRFRNVEGLTRGNNVRFSGIQSGTVKKIDIVNDTTIEVSLLIDDEVRGNIRKNSIAYIGSEGLMGNKVINIVPGIGPSLQVEEGDVLLTRAQADLSKEIGTLTQTNDNVAMISQELLQTIHKINNSPLIWSVLDDTLLLTDLHLSLDNIKASSQHINHSAALVETAMKDVRAGEGALGLLLTDKDAELKVSGILTDVNEASRRVNGLVARLDSIAATLEMSVNNKDGLVYILLNDTAFAGQLGRSLDNVENGTAAFNEDMEALKHNFLTRGYFRKKDKKSKKTKIDQNEQ